MQRNLLFIVVDCLRADMCSGNHRSVKTPTIDRLAGSGTVFTQAISSATTTSPCFGSLMTGLYPIGHGIRSHHGYKLNQQCPTLPQMLKRAGYGTKAMVTGPLLKVTGLFDDFDEYEYRAREVNLYTDWEKHLTETLVRLTERSTPWFLFLHLWELHTPRQVLPEYDRPHFGGSRYERAISSLDSKLAALFANVDLDRTVVIIHGDHGENFSRSLTDRGFRLLKRLLPRSQHYRFSRIGHVGHSYHVYDFLVRVPLIFAGKGPFPEGKRVATQVRQIDILPTIVDALDIPPDTGFPLHGRTLLPVLDGTEREDRPALMEATGMAITDPKDWLMGMRRPPWKYIFAPHNAKITPELYHLQQDPSESRNMARRLPDVAEGLKQEILETVQKLTSVSHSAVAMTDSENEIVLERLRDLGYIE